MNHEAYERQMFDTINSKAAETSKQFDVGTENTVTTKRISLMTKNDKRILKKGLKRTLLAMIAAAMVAFSVCGFVAVATAPGYLAVLLFIVSLLALGCAFIFLYAQGFIDEIPQESKGDGK